MLARNRPIFATAMRLTTTLSLLALSSFTFGQQPQKKRLTNVEVGQQAPEIVMASPSGEVLRLSQLKGKVVLLSLIHI